MTAFAFATSILKILPQVGCWSLIRVLQKFPSRLWNYPALKLVEDSSGVRDKLAAGVQSNGCVVKRGCGQERVGQPEASTTRSEQNALIHKRSFGIPGGVDDQDVSDQFRVHLLRQLVALVENPDVWHVCRMHTQSLEVKNHRKLPYIFPTLACHNGRNSCHAHQLVKPPFAMHSLACQAIYT